MTQISKNYPAIVETVEAEASRIGMTVEEAFADSLGLVGLVMAVESRFGVEIPDSVIDRIKRPYDFDRLINHN